MDEAEAGADRLPKGASRAESEWRGRPILGGLLRFAILGLPMLASLAASTLLTRLLPFPSKHFDLVVWFVGITVVATAVFFGFQRLLRRLLPLATLLSLTMIFPDRAPARFAIARQAGRVRDLEAAVARGESLGNSPGEAAATVLALVTALTSHDKGTRGHSERTRVFTDMLAAELGLSKEEQGKLRWAALLHDIGKLHVPAELLNKPGKPDAGEWEVIKAHPEQGARMIAPLVAWLGPWAEAVDHHHEKFDGTGYPHGLSGKQISLAGRIVAVADAYETMTAPRPYKRSMSVAAARQELVRSSDTHFDPVVVRAFLNISVGRLRRAVGIAAWVGQVPAGLRILEGSARLGGSVGQAATAAVATVGIVTGVVAGPHLPTVQASAAAPSVSPSPMAVVGSASPSRGAGSASRSGGAGGSAPTGGSTTPSRSSSTPGAGPSAGRAAAASGGSGAPPVTVTMPAGDPTSRPPTGPGSGGTPLPAPPPASSGGAMPPPPSANLAPTVLMPISTSAEDGAQMTPASGSFTDGDSTSWSATVDYGDGTGIQPLALSGKGFVLRHIFAAPENTSQVITVRVRDNQGAVGTGTTTNTVSDAGPEPVVPNATLAGKVYAVIGTGTDTGADGSDTYRATVDYGDGSPAVPIVVIPSGTRFTFSLTHTYLLAGTYRVHVRVTDSSGGQADGEAYITAT